MIQSQADRFDVFVSYSHSDQWIARRLAKRLARYRPPGRSKGQRLFRRRPTLRVFIDANEAAGVSLASELAQALADSQHLLVICSPAACASRYVQDEIAIFAQCHQGTGIVPVIVRGLPNSEAARCGRAAEAAFPAEVVQFIGGEPWAPSFRDTRPLWPFVKRREWYHLLAALYHSDRKTIEGREGKRRRKRGGLTALLILMLLGTLLAYTWERRLTRDDALAAALQSADDLSPDLRILVGAQVLEVSSNKGLRHRARVALASTVNNQPWERAFALDGGRANALVWNRGETVVVGMDKGTQFVNLKSGDKELKPTESYVEHLRAHPSKPWAAGLTSDGDVLLVDLGTRQQTLLEPRRAGSGSVAWCGSGVSEMMITGASHPPWPLIRWQSPSAATEMWNLFGRMTGDVDVNNGCDRVTVTAGDLLFVAAMDGTVIARAGEVNACCARWSSKDEVIATGEAVGGLSEIVIWRLRNGELSGQKIGTHNQAVRDLAWDPQGTSIASVARDGTLQIWKATPDIPVGVSDTRPNIMWKRDAVYAAGEDLLSVAWSPSGDKVITGDWYGQITVWQLDFDAARKSFWIHGKKNQILIKGSRGFETVVDTDNVPISDPDLVDFARRHVGRGLRSSECHRYPGVCSQN